MRSSIFFLFVVSVLTTPTHSAHAQASERNCFSVAPSQTRVVDPVRWAADPTIQADTEVIFTAGQYEPGIHVPTVSNVRLVAVGDVQFSTAAARAAGGDSMILIEGSDVDVTAATPAAGGGRWLFDGAGTGINVGVRVRNAGSCVALNRMTMSGMNQSGIVAGVSDILWVRRTEVLGAGSHGMEFTNVRSLRIQGGGWLGAPVRSNGNGGSGIQIINSGAASRAVASVVMRWSSSATTPKGSTLGWRRRTPTTSPCPISSRSREPTSRTTPVTVRRGCG